MPSERVAPGARVRLARVDPADTSPFTDDDPAKKKLEADIERLRRLQDVLYAARRRSVLIVLQGMDTAGKDGTVKHVISGVNPSGCEVVPFKVPNEEEAAHDFLWRVHRAAPRLGHVTIFNRSHYEDVLVPFVHRTLPRSAIEPRYDQINAFERILVENGTVIVKFFLHISKREQRRRLAARLLDPTKVWKFSPNDLVERKLWGRYTHAYEALLSRCSTRHAPWWIIPSDRKWYRNLAVAEVIVATLEKLHLRSPSPTLSKKELKKLREKLGV